jgi:branched-chain amino acid transport system ATP-binding protein
MTGVLAVENLHVSYGAVRAICGISMQVQRGEVIAVIGANGAGKTTLLKALANELPRASGRVTYKERSTAGVPPYKLAAEGLLHIPEGRGTFTTMTVLENLRLGFERDGGIPQGSFGQRVETVFKRFPQLRHKQGQLAGSLSGGEQQMLALARALLAPPDLLLLDEPSLGLAPAMVKAAFALIEEFRDHKLTMIVVEQNAVASLALADRGYVIRQGRIVLAGEATEMAQMPRLSDWYFGDRDHGGERAPDPEPQGNPTNEASRERWR